MGYLEQVLYPCLILCFHCACFAVGGESDRVFHIGYWLIVGQGGVFPPTFKTTTLCFHVARMNVFRI